MVWVVPNERRRDQLRGRLASEVANDDRLFTVVTPSDLGALVVAGALASRIRDRVATEGAK